MGDLLMGASLLWILVPGLPLLLAAGGMLPRVGRRLPALAPLAVLPALLLAWRPQPDAELSWLLLGTRMGVEPSDRLFLLGAAVLWGAAALYAGGYLRKDPGRRRFFTFFLLTLAGNLGLLVSRDPAAFYTFFALMTFSGYGLVVHSRTPEAMRAGRVYLVMALLGEVAIVSGLWLHLSGFSGINAAAPSEGQPALTFFLLLVGFGVKAGLVPLHLWLPLAHPVAPTPASAVLSGAMINAGLVGWLRYLPEAGPQAGEAVLVLGLTGAFAGAFLGFLQREAKTVLAYSSISQMGWMLLPVAAFLMKPALRPAAVQAAALFALHHGLAKGALFLATGMKGAFRSAASRSALWFALLLPALALAGLPLSSGALAKTQLKHLFTEIPGTQVSLLLSLASVATVLVLGRFLQVVRWGETETPPSRREWVALLPLMAGLLALPWAGEEGRHLSWSGLWPLLLGTVLVLLSLLTGTQKPSRGNPLLPPGDLVVPLETSVRYLQNLWSQKVAPGLRQLRGWIYALKWHEPHEIRWVRRLTGAGDRLWDRWRLCGTLFLALVLVMVWILE